MKIKTVEDAKTKNKKQRERGECCSKLPNGWFVVFSFSLLNEKRNSLHHPPRPSPLPPPNQLYNT